MFKLHEIGVSVILLFATWFSLNAIGYFAASWVLIATLVVGILARLVPIAGWLLYAFLTFMALAFHDFTLSIAWLTIALICLKQFDSTELEIAEPLWILAVFTTAFNTLNLPIEVSVFWLIGINLAFRPAFIIMFAGQVAILLGGLFTHTSHFAYLFLDSSNMPSLVLGKMSPNPLNLNWLLQSFHTFNINTLIQAVQSFIEYLMKHPLTLAEIGLITASVSAFAFFRQKRESSNNMLWLLFGSFVSLLGLSFAPLLSAIENRQTYSAVNVQSDLLHNAIVVGVFIVVYEILFRWHHKKSQAKATATTRQRASITQDRSLESMSLSDTLEMKMKLQEHLQTKFKKSVAPFDIDVAGSTNMKKGANQEDIIVSFNAYTKYVDHHCQANGGKLINRSGDGAMYVFPTANNASRAGELILKGLGKFNETKNKLGQSFNIRIGIHSGEIIADDLENKKEDVYSFVLDVAGHLQKNGSENQICISEQAYSELTDKSIYKETGFLKTDNIYYRLSIPIY